jgi:hypothetical protein
VRQPNSTPHPVDEAANANADAQKVASDAEAEVADIKTKQDAIDGDDDKVEGNSKVAPKTAKPGAIGAATGAIGGGARHVGRNWLRYGLGGAALYALKSMYDEAVTAPIMADADQGYVDDAYAPAEEVQAMDPYSPEARIRRLQRVMGSGQRVPLIPQTLSRPF